MSRAIAAKYGKAVGISMKVEKNPKKKVFAGLRFLTAPLLANVDWYLEFIR